jgi:hypothetical protein
MHSTALGRINSSSDRIFWSEIFMEKQPPPKEAVETKAHQGPIGPEAATPPGQTRSGSNLLRWAYCASTSGAVVSPKPDRR